MSQLTMSNLISGILNKIDKAHWNTWDNIDKVKHIRYLSMEVGENLNLREAYILVLVLNHSDEQEDNKNGS